MLFLLRQPKVRGVFIFYPGCWSFASNYYISKSILSTISHNLSIAFRWELWEIKLFYIYLTLWTNFVHPRRYQYMYVGGWEKKG